MFKWLGILTDSNEKEIRRLEPVVAQINSLEPDFQGLSDAELRAKTDEFKARLKNGETLDELLPEAFATVREAARRTIKQRHFDVQLMGGIVLHQGKIAEMKTGEGKTLVATLPLYLNALTGEGCHLVTVNDYLARRDAYWMSPIYHALGISVASIYPQQNPDEHLPARLYDPDYTDEQDSRWPHYKPITRRQAYEADITYGTNNEFGFDYLRDNMALDLSQYVQRPLNYAIVDEVDNILIDEARTPLIISGAAEEATQKYYVFARLVPQLKRDEDYTIEERERQVYLTEPGMAKMERSLHREGLLKAPSLYDPANYGLNRYMENALKAQVLFKRDRDYVVKDGQVIIVDDSPVLVGTVSIEKSEHLSDLLKRKGVPYQILNAKNHTKEADIIAQAGKVGAVTVATNMAGRGVDIILGGNPAERDEKEWQEEHDRVVELGGLHVLGTERHEARRIDNQLRGRSGRQGDPGSSRFYVSLEDDVVRRFGGDRVKGFMDWAGFDENTPIEHSMVNKAIENAQVKVEGYHFDIRKHLVDYDDVVNKHREVVYAERKKILSGADLKANILSMVRDEIESLVAAHCSNDLVEPDYSGLIEDAATIFPLPPELNPNTISQMKPKQNTGKLIDYAEQLYEHREKEIGADNMRLLERLVMLRTIDSLWKDHLTAMDELRQRAGLYAVRQVDPLVIYKKEGHAYFDSLLASIQHDVANTIYKVTLTKKEVPPQRQRQKVAVPAGRKVGRNDPCPCGSGKKYKHCCGR